MKKIKVNNEEIIVRDSLCSTNKNKEKKTEPRVRLYIKLTDGCCAKCKFCANGNCKDFGTIDLNKLEYTIRYLMENNILHGISITGGEPMMNPEVLNNVLNLIYSISKDMEVAISTNGYNLKEFIKIDHVNDLESIHISKHHYDDSINYEIFGSTKVASTDDIMYLQDFLDDKRIININTLVMKDYINNLEEIKKMLDYVGKINVYKNGFVSLMKCNDYSKEQFINFNDIFNNLDNNFFLGHHFYSEEYCECVDGVYLSKYNDLVEFYARMVKNCECPYTTQLVYTSDNKLTAGFGKKILIK